MIGRWIKRAVASLLPDSTRHNVVLAYHSIGAGCRFSQAVEGFEEQLILLGSHFRVVPVESVVAATQTGRSGLAAITFDDGFADLYTDAFPVLRRLHYPFTTFLTTAFLEEDRNAFGWSPHYAGLKALTWAQIREMINEGCSVGSHTHSHARLSECTAEQILAELTQSKRIIERRLGVEVNSLAYPFGQIHDYDERAVQAAKDAGYCIAFTTSQTCLTSIRKPYEIPRVMIDATDDRDDFTQKITGRRDFVASVECVNSSLIRMGLRRPPVSAPPSSVSSVGVM